MEWLERLNDSLKYIEENLAGEIDYGKAAEIACCSVFHYQRMFSYIANVPLGEYIRRRKMTLAAFELQRSDIKVIDLALKYGYDSPTAFNRAFQSVHQMSPSSAREEGVQLKAYSPMTFRISIKGESEMNYKIEKKEPLRIVGVKRTMGLNVEENFREVPAFWEETFKNGMFEKIGKLSNLAPLGTVGVCAEMNEKTFDYYIAAVTDQPVPEGMEEYTIPAGLWAVFPCVGPMPQALQDLQKRIVTDWLPTSGYEYSDAPDVEVYPFGNPVAEDYYTEAWLPIVKKGEK